MFFLEGSCWSKQFFSHEKGRLFWIISHRPGGSFLKFSREIQNWHRSFSQFAKKTVIFAEDKRRSSFFRKRRHFRTNVGFQKRLVSRKTDGPFQASALLLGETRRSGNRGSRFCQKRLTFFVGPSSLVSQWSHRIPDAQCVSLEISFLNMIEYLNCGTPDLNKIYFTEAHAYFKGIHRTQIRFLLLLDMDQKSPWRTDSGKNKNSF